MFGYDWARVHALLTALPVALLSLAIVLELASLLFKRADLRGTSLLLLVIGSLGAAAALGAGLQAQGTIDHGPALHDVMEEHEHLALVTFGIFAVLSIWRLVRERKMGAGERAAALVVGLVGLAFLVDTGHHGGKLVFEHAAGVPNATLRAELTNRSEAHQHGAAQAHEHGDEHTDGTAAHQHDIEPGPSGHHDADTPDHQD